MRSISTRSALCARHSERLRRDKEMARFIGVPSDDITISDDSTTAAYGTRRSRAGGCGERTSGKPFLKSEGSSRALLTIATRSLSKPDWLPHRNRIGYLANTYAPGFFSH